MQPVLRIVILCEITNVGCHLSSVCLRQGIIIISFVLEMNLLRHTNKVHIALADVCSMTWKYSSQQIDHVLKFAFGFKKNSVLVLNLFECCTVLNIKQHII